MSDQYQRWTRAAMAVAACMLAHQVAGKAARDALYLAEFMPRDLPKIVSIAAFTAIVFSFAFSRALARLGPRRVVPLAFLASAFMHAAEWLLLAQYPKAVVVFTYLHIVGLGAILLSGFWALASEMFDPREAKVRFGRIAGVGTAGGIAGGVLAERTAAWFSTSAILLPLAALHLACGVILWIMRQEGAAAVERQQPEKLPSRRAVFQGAPYLVSLAVLVLLGTTTAAMLDYLFKSGAAATYGGRSPELLRYFAMFYTGAQVLTFIVQTAVSRFALEKLGLSRTIASLPVAVGVGSGAALLVPLFGAIASVRALELILRGSLFRAGYELFYTPVAPREKRAVKVMIDVGCDRLGDAVGAAIVQGAIWLGPSLARPELLSISILLAVIATWIASRLDKAYTMVLEKGLIDRAVELDFRDVHDSTTMTALMRTMSMRKLDPPTPAATPLVPKPPAPRDSMLELFTDLRSGDARRVRAALANECCEEPVMIPQLIRLLAWDEVCDGVLARLASAAPRIVGQLSDALLDEREEFAIRRRIPRLLTRVPQSPRAIAALLEALSDSRFEVRFQAARALDAIRQKHPDTPIPEGPIFAVVERELSVSRTIWDGHRLLDRREVAGTESSDNFSFLDEVLRERANASLEHVFSLLAVVLPREPLKVAFRALHSDDRQFRGLGLEYLESTLPPGVREKLWAVIEEKPATAGVKPPREVLDQLMLSSETLQLRVRDIRNAGTS